MFEHLKKRYTFGQEAMILLFAAIPIGFAIWFGVSGYQLTDFSLKQKSLAIALFVLYGFIVRAIVKGFKNNK